MDFVNSIYKRIYIVLSIFMVFKLTFSFFKYLVSPDAMNDKEQGVGKLISRVIIMIVLLIAFPIVFFNPFPGDSEGRTIIGILQDGVVKTLPRLITGQSIDSSDSSTTETFRDDGRELALSMLKSFYYPSVCNSESDAYDSDQAENCNKYFQGESASVSGKNLISIDEFKNFTDTVSSKGDNGYYAYQYMWPLTTVAGILMIVIMLGFSIDVAIRSFKLLILEVMAPVPIMTYIDPKASKDGAFSAWTKSLISTYIDLFVKLGSVYLILLLSSELFKGNLFEDTGLSGMSALYLKVFLVIGLFQFAKEAPKFIKEALGIKDSGGGFMDGLKTLGKAAGVAGGAALGALSGGIAGVSAAKAAGNKGFTAAMKGIGGGISGLARGGIQGGKGAGKGNPIAGLSGALSSQSAVNQKKMVAAHDGSTFWGRQKERFGSTFTGLTSADKDEEEIANLEQKKEAFDRQATTAGNLYDYIMDKGAKAGASTVVAANHTGKDGKPKSVATSYDNFNTAYKNAQQKGLSTFEIKTSDGKTEEFETFSGSTAKFASDLQEASATQWAIDNAGDAMLQKYQEDAGVSGAGYGKDDYNAVGLKDTKKKAEADSRGVTATIYNTKTSSSYKANKANAAAIKRNGK